MIEGMPPLALNFFTELGETAGFVVRLAVALVGALLAWYVSSPVAKGLYRLIVQRPMPSWAVVVTRLSAAVAVGVLLYHFVTFGSGGGGTGGGQGSGVGPGSGGGIGSGSGVGPGSAGGTDKGKQPEVKPGEPSKTSRIEMILSKRYKGDNRWYLIESRPPPKLIGEVEAYLKAHKGKFQNMDIILYGNSVDKGARAVMDLEELGAKYKLRIYFPKEYWSKDKAETPE